MMRFFMMMMIIIIIIMVMMVLLVHPQSPWIEMWDDDPDGEVQVRLVPSVAWAKRLCKRESRQV